MLHERDDDILLRVHNFGELFGLLDDGFCHQRSHDVCGGFHEERRLLHASQSSNSRARRGRRLGFLSFRLLLVALLLPTLQLRRDPCHRLDPDLVDLHGLLELILELRLQLSVRPGLASPLLKDHEVRGLLGLEMLPLLVVASESIDGPDGLLDLVLHTVNLVVFQSAALAGIFTTRFNQFWASGSFHEVKNPGPFGASFSGIDVEVLFGPHWAPIDRLVEAIEEAEEAIHFSIFAFTLEEVKEALLSRCGEVEILGVYDWGQAANNDSVASKGWCASAHVKAADVQPSPGVSAEYGFRKLHHKLLIVDPGTTSGLVLTGSTNWSYSAATKNDEVMITIRAPEVVSAFESEFQARYAEAQ